MLVVVFYLHILTLNRTIRTVWQKEPTANSEEWYFGRFFLNSWTLSKKITTLKFTSKENLLVIWNNIQIATKEYWCFSDLFPLRTSTKQNAYWNCGQVKTGLERERNIFILRVSSRPAPYRWIKNLLASYAYCCLLVFYLHVLTLNTTIRTIWQRKGNWKQWRMILW